LGELLFNLRGIPAVSKAATRPCKSAISDRSWAKVSLVSEATVSAVSYFACISAIPQQTMKLAIALMLRCCKLLQIHVVCNLKISI
jgi:hypothetical protein